MIHLHNDSLLGQGRQKTVYHHPEDHDLCIKIPKQGCEHSLKREIKYTSKHQKNLTSVGAYRGSIDTNIGTGYLFDIVRDSDGQISMTLEDFMKADHDESLLLLKVARLHEQLLENKAALSELEPCNILVKKKSASDYTLVIIDGFGNSDFIKICDISRHFLKKKLHRKFSKFCKEAKIPNTFLTPS